MCVTHITCVLDIVLNMLNRLARVSLWQHVRQALCRIGAENPELDSDLDQARIRRFIGWCVLPWWFWDAINQEDTLDWMGLAMNIVFIVGAELFYRHYRRQGAGTLRMRLLSALVDQGTCALVLLWGGVDASPFLFIFLWVAIGYALHFGAFYAAISALFGVAGLFAVCMLDAAWSAHQELQLSWAVAIAVIPVYTAILAQRIHGTKHVMRRVAEQTRYSALHDPLTGLANRACFEGQVAGQLVMLKESAIRRSSSDAVLLINLDGFKNVNEAHGHAVGDVLLKTVAAILSNRLRAIDTVARLGADEFAALLTGVRSVVDIDRIAQQLVSDIAAITSIKGHQVRVSASAGIGIIDPGDTVPGVLKRADQSMYEAKAEGKLHTDSPYPHHDTGSVLTPSVT